MAGIFSRLFGKKTKNTNKAINRRLEILGLEERITPAVTASFSSGTLLLANVGGSETFTVSADVNGVLTVTGLGSAISGGVNVTIGGFVGANTITVNSGGGGAAAVSSLSFTGDASAETITLTNIYSTAFNTNFGISFALGAGNDYVKLGGSISLKGTGTFVIDDPSSGVDAIVLGEGTDLTLTSASGVITLDSASGGFGTSLANNVTINSTSGNVTLGDPIDFGLGKNLAIDSGTGTVTATGTLGVLTPLGNLTIASNATLGSGSAISLAAVSAGAVSLTATGDIRVSGAISAGSVNTKSTGGDVIFEDTVSTYAIGGFISEATLETKSTRIAKLVTAYNGANALVNGNLVTTSDIGSATAGITVEGTADINITGKVDASAAGNDLTLSSKFGNVNLAGNFGSANSNFGNLTVTGGGAFLASGTVTAGGVDVRNFATSITFAKAVTAVGITNGDGVFVTSAGVAPIVFSDAITVSGPFSSLADVYISSANGPIHLTGNINGVDSVTVISNSGDITLSGNVATSGTSNVTGAAGGDITIGYSTGSVLLSGNISTTGTGAITLFGNKSVVANGALSTTGTNSGQISINALTGSTVAINKAISAGSGANVALFTTGTGAISVAKDAKITAGASVTLNSAATGVINIASGADITAGNDVIDVSSGGTLSLGANITTTAGNILFNSLAINLTGAVSLKSQGDINLNKVNGAENLTMETTGPITLASVGQTIPLNTVTVNNSSGLNSFNFSAANVVLADTTGSIRFINTVITNTLTTATKAYYLEFSGTTVLSGAPVFLNTGNGNFSVRLSGTTSLPNGATITGNAVNEVYLSGTIVSGGAFNIGVSGNTGSIIIADGTQLILNSTSAGSNFANPISLNGSQAGGKLSLLGVGALTLSGDSSSVTTSGDTIEVINGTLNVTGKLGPANVTSATNGTITGAGGTIGTLNVNTGTVAPGGTLSTGAVNFNVATNYKVDLSGKTTASNLQTSSAILLGGATLSLGTVASGLDDSSVLTIIDNTASAGTNLITTTFAGLPEGGTLSANDADGNTVYFAISYIGGAGSNDVTLSVLSVIPQINLPMQPMVAGQPVLNKFLVVGADAGGGPLVTVTLPDGTYTTFFAYASTFTGGVRVASADVNGDGSLDIITGPGAGGGPQVNIFSFTPTGAVFLRQSFFAFNNPNFTGGVYVAVGDTNADGFDDVILGAGATGGPRVQVYAGGASGLVTGSPLNDFFAYSPAFTGGVVVAAGDRNADGDDEVITAPASNGGYNIKSFDCNGTGNNPTVVDNFFAFNNTTARGGLSLAVGLFDAGNVADIVVGTSNAGFGVILNNAYSGIVTVPFAGFTGAIRAGVAEDSNGLDYAVALAGPNGGPRVSVFSVGASSLTETDNLFVMNPQFTGGLFGTPTL